MKLLNKALEQLGMSPNAVRLYTESYSRGRTTVGKLAAAINMDRSSAYLAYEQLKGAGLMEEDIASGIKVVWAATPDSVLKGLRSNASQLERSINDLAAQLPELIAGYRTTGDKPVLQSFSGKDTLPRITADILESDLSTIRIITNQNAERKVFSARAHDDFIQKRIQKKIKAFVLAANTREARFLQKYDSRELRETRIVDDLEPFKHETYIYGDKVAVLGFEKNVFGFIVYTREFAALQRYMFDTIWKATKGK